MTYDTSLYRIREDIGVRGGNSGNGGIDNSLENPHSFPYILKKGGSIVNQDLISSSGSSSSSGGGSSRNSKLSPEERLWSFHRTILSAYARIPATDYCKENYDQFAMYFELMRVVEGGNDLVMEVLGRVRSHRYSCF